MSYGTSSALQQAVFQALMTSPELGALVGSAIYDALPSGSLPSIYVALGTETARDRSDKTGRGAEHDLTVSVVTDTSGFQTAKDAAGTISDVLDGADLALTRGTLVALRFLKAAARREGTGTGRRIDMTFRARVADD